ncbi:MAG: FHA domain-containing protein [Myxococcaceae bacterium]
MTAGSGARPRVQIRVVRADGGPESVLPMQADVLTCGTQGEITLKDDPFVAGVQARFFFSGSRLAVEDVGGGNGLFFRLRTEREVLPGGELRLGRQRLLIEPIPSVAPNAGGAIAWGSTDPGYRFRLVQMLEGGLRGGAHPLKEGDNLIGRELGDITFAGDGFVSGRHASIQVRPDRLILKDLGSSNGTFVKLNAPAFIETQDQFLIGRELLRVELL